MSQEKFLIAAFYQFADFPDFAQWQEPLRNFGKAHDVKGSILLAHEGINGTIAGLRPNVEAMLAMIREDGRFATMPHKESFADFVPFGKMKVRLKPEIVNLGIDEIDPQQEVGAYVPPQEWNQLISDPDVLLIDTRNDFEVQIGTFKGALNPGTDAFNHLPEFVQSNLKDKKDKKIAMFCTGGIRCEKATAYLLQQGFENVYHLQGGILNYLANVPEADSMWQGDCFVFDERVAVNHDLEPKFVELCYACQALISDEDRQSPHYEQGVCCHRCYDSIDPEIKARSRRRRAQKETN